MYHSWVEIDLKRLRENIRNIQSAVAPKSEIIFVVKADAYGHGLRPVAKTAAEENVNWFATAYLEAALVLREELPDVNLLVLGHVSPDQVDLLLEKRIIPVITDIDHGLALAKAAQSRNKKLNVHLKIDTGMGRLGIAWDRVSYAMSVLENESGLNISGACSHFAKVDPNDPIDADSQAEKFEAALTHMPKDLFRHLSSSRAALYFPEWDYDGVRQGIDLYGYGASDPKGRFQTLPILQWKSRIAQIKSVPTGFPVGYYGTYTTDRPTRIATLEVGYADGYNRALSNRGDVLIGGKRCPVIGRVSMNWIIVDLGPESKAKVGDEAVLIGEQGAETIWADELARICRTIPYEILTSINASVERKYTC